MFNPLRSIILLLGLPLLLAQCDDGGSGVQTQDPGNPENPDSNQRRVLIINEGNFNNGNASLGIYYPKADTFRSDVFENKTGRPLGDVFQSVTFARKQAFLVINNSGKIEVVDSSTLESTGVVKGLPSPRYMQPLSDGRAYVTNFTQSGESEISIVNYQSLQITGKIPTGGWTGNPAVAAGKVWVPEVKAGWLLVVDPNNDVITDTLKLRPEVTKIVRDAEGKLWAMANGGINNSVKPALYRINPENKQITRKLVFPSKSPSPGNLTLNGSLDTLYYTRKGIYRLSIDDPDLPVNPIVPAKDRSFYGLGIAPGTGTIYASDASDFVRRGQVFRFDPENGRLINEFEAGIGPAGFVFP
jgi:hypothetical protein